MQEDYAKEEEKITGEVRWRPIIKIKSREVDLKARKTKEKKKKVKKDLDLRYNESYDERSTTR